MRPGETWKGFFQPPPPPLPLLLFKVDPSSMLPCLFISALGNLNGTQRTSLRHHLSKQPPCLVLTIDRSRQPAQSSFSSWTRSRRASFENRMHPFPLPPPPLPCFFLQPSHEGAGPDAFLATQFLAIAARSSPISNINLPCLQWWHALRLRQGRGWFELQVASKSTLSSTASLLHPRTEREEKAKQAHTRTHTHAHDYTVSM